MNFAFRKYLSLQSLSGLAIFSLLASYFFYPVIMVDKLTLAFYGDGWGTIGGIFDRSDNFRHLQSPMNMFTDLYVSKGIGAGINWIGFPSNWFWNIVDVIFSFFVDADNIYDLTLAFSWVLIGFAGFTLGRSLGISFGFCLCIGLTLMFCENFFIRSMGHRTLATYFMPIFLIAGVLQFIKEMNYKHSIILGICCWLNFQVNEYFGFFGIFIAAAIILAFSISRIRHFKSMLQPLSATVVGALVFTFLMMVSYPNLVFMRFYQFFSSSAGASLSDAEFSHDLASFDLFSLQNPWVLFAPRLAFLKDISPPIVFEGVKIWEASFGLGIIIPFVVILSTLIHFVVKPIYLRTVDKSHFRLLFALLAGLGVAFCFGVNSTNSWSLVPFIMKYLPIFRVGARAFLYMNIILIGIYWTYIYLFWRQDFSFFSSPVLKKTSQVFLRTVLVLLGVGAIWEVRGGEFKQIFSRPPSISLPELAAYEVLEKYPAGVLIEIPFNYYGFNNPEEEYNYFLHRSIHKKVILNGLPFSSTFWPAHRRLTFQRNFNEIDAAKVELFRSLGIRYIAIDKSRAKTVKFEDLGHLKKVSDQQATVIYEINEPAHFDVQRVRNYIWPSYETIDLSTIEVGKSPSIELLEKSSNRLDINYKGTEETELLLGPKVALEPGSYLLNVKLEIKSRSEDLRLIVSSPQLGEISNWVIPFEPAIGQLQSGDFEFSLKSIAETQIRIVAKGMTAITLNELKFTRETPMSFQGNFISDTLSKKQSKTL